MSTARTLIRARALTGFAALVAEHGGDAPAMLAAAGLTPELLDEPDATLSLDQLAHLLEHAASALALPDFGLRLAQRQDINVLGAVALIALHSATVGAAWQGIAKYFPYHTPGGRLDLVHDADPDFVHIHYDLRLAADSPRRQAIELSFGVAFRFTQLMAADPLHDAIAHFRHAPGMRPSGYRKHVGCALAFDQPGDVLILPRRVLAAPIVPERADLRVAAERYVQHVVQRFPLDIGRQVADLAERQLATGGVRIERIAAQLGLSRRTLQRRLAAQGLYFEDVIDELRRRRAAEYLPHGAIPLAQVGGLLGYSEQASFIRACRRWFGATPQQVRARGAVPPASTLLRHSPVTGSTE